MKLKKLFSVCVSSVLAVASISAYEATAKVTMEGALVRETKAKDADAKAQYEVLKLDPINSHSKNGVVIDLTGAIAGAHFEMFYELDGTAKAEDGWAVSAGNTHLWFKPIDMLKVRLGYVGRSDFFVERVGEEKVGNPFAAEHRKDDTVPEYITNADTDEMGFSLECLPIDGLSVSAAMAPGVDVSGITVKKGTKTAVAPWGVVAKYNWNDFTFGAAYRDNGQKSWKVIRAGASYETDDLYAFVQPVVGISYVSSKEKYEVNGFCLDMYGEYSLDALKFTAHVPVTIRTSGDKDNDPSYMEYLAMAEYNFGSVGLLDEVTPYVCISSNEIQTFGTNAKDDFGMDIQAGTGFKVGLCSVDVGACLSVNAASSDSAKVTWSIPFSVSMEF